MTTALFPGKALLIGVNKNKYEAKLNREALKSEVIALGKLLADPAYGYDEFETLTALYDDRATIENIKAELANLQKIDLGSTHTVLILLAGHGIVQNGHYYFFTYETKYEKQKLDEQTALCQEYILQEIEKIPAKNIAVLFNTCYAEAAGTDLTLKLDAKEGWVMVFSSAKNEKSYVLDADHSIFGKHLLDALALNIVNIVSLYLYLDEHMGQHAQAPTAQMSAFNFPIALPSRAIHQALYSLIWKSSADVTSIDIMGAQRGAGKHFYEDYYYRRAEDKAFLNALTTRLIQAEKGVQNHLLVIGRPLAGKSRLVYEALKQLKEPVAILKPHYADVNRQIFGIPSMTHLSHRPVLFLDDLHRYIEFNDFPYLLQQVIARREILIIATCRSGKEYDLVTKFLLDKKYNIDLANLCFTLEVGPIEPTKAQKIAKKVNISWEKVEFDGTIGSIFLQLSEMRRRYHTLDEDNTQVVLWALNLAYQAGLYLGHLAFPQAWIQHLVQQKYDLNLNPIEWVRLIKDLTNLDFVHLQHDPSRLLIEETYLENIINREHSIFLLQEVDSLREIFTNDANALLRLGTRLFAHGKTALIQNQQFFQAALRVYQTIIQPWQTDAALPTVSSPLERLELLLTTSLALNSMGVIYMDTGEPQKALEHFQQSYDIEKRLGDHAGMANQLGNMGVIYRRIGEPQKALEHHQQSYDIHHRLGDQAGVARQLINMGNIYRRIGEIRKALKYFQQSYDIHHRLADQAGMAIALGSMAIIYDQTGELQKALEHHQQSYDIHHRLADQAGMAIALGNMAIIYDQTGELQKALEYHQQSYDIHHRLGDHAGMANQLGNMGVIYRRIGEPQKALEHFQQSYDIHHRLGDQAGMANQLGNMGIIYAQTGEPQKALEHFQQSYDIHQLLGDHAGMASQLGNMGLIYMQTGEPQKALEHFQQSYDIHHRLGNRTGMASALGNMGLIYMQTGEPQKALGHFQQSYDIEKRLGNRTGMASALGNMGLIYMDIGEPQKALEHFQQSYDIEKRLGNRTGMANALGNMGLIYRQIGEPQKALEHFQQSYDIEKRLGNQAGMAIVLGNMGLIYRQIGEPQKALEHFQQSYNVHHRLGNLAGKAIQLGNMAIIYAQIGEPQKALEYFQQSYEIFQRLNYPREMTIIAQNIERVNKQLQAKNSNVKT
ncbi:MAG: tetratricopeptide repeat protein [Candidatus Hermodarchaeota archaeon]